MDLPSKASQASFRGRLQAGGGSGGPVQTSVHVQLSACWVHGPQFLGRSEEGATVPSCTDSRFLLGRRHQKKIRLLVSSRPASLPSSTPPLDSAAHHIATRQIRASCSISTVLTLVNSAIMGAEKDGFPAVPLRTAQTLNSTVVWAVSEAPNISRRLYDDGLG